MQQELFKIRDLRKKEQFIIDDLYLSEYAKVCGIYATGVYVSLCRHANKEQKSWPSLDKIAQELNISKMSVRRGVGNLEKQNIIKRERMGKKLNNRYYLIDKSEWHDRTLTVSPQNTHQVHHRTLHSKETQYKDTHSKERPAKAAALDSDFEKWWNIYPRKISKKKAMQAWKKINPNTELKRKMVLAVLNHKESQQWQQEEYIPYPATWLNQERWNDTLPKAKEKEKVPHYKGDKVVYRFGKAHIISKNGEWLELGPGTKNDIEML